MHASQYNFSEFVVWDAISGHALHEKGLQGRQNVVFTGFDLTMLLIFSYSWNYV